MKLSDVKVGMRVACYRPHYIGDGTVRRVAHGAIYVMLDHEASNPQLRSGRAFTREQIEPPLATPAPSTGYVENDEAGLELLSPAEIEAALRAARASREAEEQRARNGRRALGEAQRGGIQDQRDAATLALVGAGLTGNGSNLAEWVRNYRPVDDPSIQRQITNEPAVLRRMREAAEQARQGAIGTLSREYINAYRDYLAGVGMGQVPKESVPTKPLAIGTPPRKLCLPENPKP